MSAPVHRYVSDLVAARILNVSICELRKRTRKGAVGGVIVLEGKGERRCVYDLLRLPRENVLAFLSTAGPAAGLDALAAAYPSLVASTLRPVRLDRE